MSDTPKTDAMMTALLWRTGETLPTDVEFGNFARQLERENAALKEELAPLRETVGVRGDAVTSRDDIAYWCKLMDRAGKADRLERENAALKAENAALKAENAALREAFAKADVLAEYMRSDGRREWQTIECWVYPNDIIVQMDRAAFDAARKEAQPCQCTNGVIRSVGRDNDEVIEDCPDCSGSKEVQP